MKHIYVIESSGGRKWRPSGGVTVVRAYYDKRSADASAKANAHVSPGLKWRVAKYARVEAVRP